MTKYEEIRHFGLANFVSLVETPSTKQVSTKTTDRFDQTTERVVYYRGNRILGVQVRNITGYRYYVRK